MELGVNHEIHEAHEKWRSVSERPKQIQRGGFVSRKDAEVQTSTYCTGANNCISVTSSRDPLKNTPSFRYIIIG